MVGRPRKAGRRERNGRVQRTYENPRAQVAAQPHRREVRVELREREEAESAFGRLMLRGIITPAMYEAGKLYAELAGRYRAIILSAPLPHPRGMDLTHHGRSVSQETPSHIAATIRDRYNAAFECLPGAAVQRALAEHVIREKPVSDFHSRDLLKIGLGKLVKFFGLDGDLQIRELVKNAR